MVECFIQLRACKFRDEIVLLLTEKDLGGILHSFKINVGVFGVECLERDYIARMYCETKGIEFYFNTRYYGSSSMGLRRDESKGEDGKIIFL